MAMPKKFNQISSSSITLIILVFLNTFSSVASQTSDCSCDLIPPPPPPPPPPPTTNCPPPPSPSIPTIYAPPPPPSGSNYYPPPFFYYSPPPPPPSGEYWPYNPPPYTDYNAPPPPNPILPYFPYYYMNPPQPDNFSSATMLNIPSLVILCTIMLQNYILY
ncbi:hypothetical protein ACH5RR_013884 [Cinchona calisaya]|uniref:Uncharacterized protein n=1 Tax=Cinchona calisaya TaxID=153742 RepID=A0ABD3A4Z9_9GENT